MISRVERTRFAEWWWTVDRMMLAAIAVLMMTGIVLSLAASPAVATRIGLDAFYFVNRHAMYLAPTFLVMIAVSFLSPRQIRRLALAVFQGRGRNRWATAPLAAVADLVPPPAPPGPEERASGSARGSA